MFETCAQLSFERRSSCHRHLFRQSINTTSLVRTVAQVDTVSDLQFSPFENARFRRNVAHGAAPRSNFDRRYHILTTTCARTVD